MTLSDEQLQQVKAYAFDLLSWKDIAWLLDLDLQQFKAAIENPAHPVSHAYHKGKTERKAALRKPVLRLASQGAPQAELLAQKFLEEQSYAETDE